MRRGVVIAGGGYPAVPQFCSYPEAVMSNVEGKKDLGPILIQTIRSSELSGTLQDVAEIALDSVLDEGILKDIPIIGSIVSVGKTTIAVRDRLLVRKVLIFLEGLKDIPREQREEFSNKIWGDEKFERRVGETIMMMLDRYDHFDKPRLMSNLFAAYLREEIEYDEFLRLATAIDRAFMKDVNTLLEYFSGRDNDAAVRRAKRNLYTSNLSDFYVLTEEEFRRSGLEHPQVYHFNQQATKFAEIILGNRFHSGRW
jgi:hypothetical protein